MVNCSMIDLAHFLAENCVNDSGGDWFTSDGL